LAKDIAMYITDDEELLDKFTGNFFKDDLKKEIEKYAKANNIKVGNMDTLQDEISQILNNMNKKKAPMNVAKTLSAGFTKKVNEADLHQKTLDNVRSKLLSLFQPYGDFQILDMTMKGQNVGTEFRLRAKSKGADWKSLENFMRNNPDFTIKNISKQTFDNPKTIDFSYRKMNEAMVYNDYEEAQNKAIEKSKKGVAYHVVEKANGTYVVTNQYDEENTILSYLNGGPITEGKPTMKKSELKDIIKEEIKKILNLSK
jgi:hypothetical protein